MKKAILWVSIICSGCQTTAPLPTHCPSLNPPPAPTIPIDNMSVNDSPADIMQAFVESIVILRSDNEALRRQMDSAI